MKMSSSLMSSLTILWRVMSTSSSCSQKWTISATRGKRLRNGLRWSKRKLVNSLKIKTWDSCRSSRCHSGSLTVCKSYHRICSKNTDLVNVNAVKLTTKKNLVRISGWSWLRLAKTHRQRLSGEETRLRTSFKVRRNLKDWFPKRTTKRKTFLETISWSGLGKIKNANADRS